MKKYVGPIIIVLVILGVVVKLHLGGGHTTENPDKFCKKLLAKPGARELLPWLKEGKHSIGESTSDEKSIEIANGLYSLGPESVMAIEIDKYPGGLENTGKLVIKLPREKSKRQAILNWSAKIARAQGFDAYTDVGQDYVFVSLD